MKNPKKVAIVSGSATGVGAASCIKLAQRGWNVVINFTKSLREAEQTAELCRSYGNEVLMVRCDVSDDGQCRDMVQQAFKRWGRVDALVNNAGTTRFCSYSDLEGLSKKDFQDIYAVNVIGAYQLSRAAVPYLKESEDGVIVNISSISAISGVGSSMAYAASKGALSTMTLSLAHALAPDIRVNAICPGFIQGRWTKNFLGERYEEVKTHIEKASLLQRTTVPEDIADSVVFLIEHARLISGEIITVDGGNIVNQHKLG